MLLRGEVGRVLGSISCRRCVHFGAAARQTQSVVRPAISLEAL